MLVFNHTVLKKFAFVLTSVWAMAGLLSCRHEPDPASLAEVSFAGRIQPIIQSNCGKSGCHSGSGEHLFSLRTYEEISSKVTPNKPHQSELYKNMIYLEDFRVMPPPPDQPMTEEQLGLIYTWILQGAKNN